MLPFHYLHISNLPRIHSIVWCRLPDEQGHLGETVRPALVRESKRDMLSGRSALRVSYGTTILDSNKFGHIDFIVQNAARLDELDLPMAVRFDLSQANWLPWAAEFFEPPEHSLYVVAGVLNENERKRLRSRLKRRGVLVAL